MTRGLVEQGLTPTVIAARWALVFAALAFGTSLIALVIVLRTR